MRHHFRIIESFTWHAPVRHGDWITALATFIGPLGGACVNEIRDGYFVSLEEQLVANDECKDQALMIDALAAKHAADADGAEVLQQIAKSFVIH